MQLICRMLLSQMRCCCVQLLPGNVVYSQASQPAFLLKMAPLTFGAAGAAVLSTPPGWPTHVLRLNPVENFDSNSNDMQNLLAWVRGINLLPQPQPDPAAANFVQRPFARAQAQPILAPVPAHAPVPAPAVPAAGAGAGAAIAAPAVAAAPPVAGQP
jgi:hypothetical protein